MLLLPDVHLSTLELVFGLCFGIATITGLLAALGTTLSAAGTAAGAGGAAAAGATAAGAGAADRSSGSFFGAQFCVGG